MASLFQACKTVVRNQASDTLNIGGYDIGLELYHQSDIDDDVQYGNVSWGDNDESKIVVVADDTITIPSGYTLTPDSPKKSLVLFCNNLVNNGTISMYQKAPNVLPHDYFIIEGGLVGSNKNIIIPAYANNQTVIASYKNDELTPAQKKGASGTDRNCGAGGFGANMWGVLTNATNGSGYAFGGGAGTGGSNSHGATIDGSLVSVDSIYPMRGGSYYNSESNYFANGGTGNPSGSTQASAGYNGKYIEPNFGCGGRIIIFCNSFTNNGTITVRGTNAHISLGNYSNALGGASGAGAIDIFYTSMITQGTLDAIGGEGGNASTKSTDKEYYAGAGGNGSITLTQWTQNKIVKETIKYFSRSNVNYLLTQMAERIKDSRMGE